MTNDPQVPIKRTDFTPAEYARALFYAWRDLFGEFPSKQSCAVLFAQWALETGKGHFCWNFNIGNVKEIPDDGLPYFQLPGTWEIVGGKKVVLDKSNPGAWFTAFSSLAEGMAHHLRFLSTRRYAPAWPHVIAGDADGFARALKARGYYTAPVEDYARLMRRFYVEFMSVGHYEASVRDSLVTTQDPDAPQPIVRPPVTFR